MLTASSILVSVLLPLGVLASQLYLRAAAQNNPWPEDSSNGAGGSSSRRPNTGPGSRDMSDVCARRCRCEGDRLEFVTCSGLSDFGPIQDEFACPNRIESLILINVTFKASRNGQAVRLDANNFTDFRQLTTLKILNSSCINIINYSAFLPSRNRLRHIEIRNSRVQRIESGAFAYLDLDTLDLSDNRLYYHQKISPGTFQDARSIRNLVLRNTSLSALPTSVLAPIAASLTSLDISYNRLHTLSSDLIPVFCQLGKLIMNNNTWCCAKPGRWLSLFLRLTMDQLPDKIAGAFPPTCEGGPRPLKGRLIADVSYEEMDKYETCEGLLGPRDPKTCQELLAKFHELFAAEPSSHNQQSMLAQAIQQQQQHQLTLTQRTERYRQRITTTKSYDDESSDRRRLSTNSNFNEDYDANEQDEDESRQQVYIAAGASSKGQQQQQQGDDNALDQDHTEDADGADGWDNQDDSFPHDFTRRRGALSAQATPSCGFVDCNYIIYAVIGTVGFICLVGLGIGIYTMAIRRVRSRSRHHLVERITS